MAASAQAVPTSQAASKEPRFDRFTELPSALVRNILERVPGPTLDAVCKEWRSSAYNPPFLRQVIRSYQEYFPSFVSEEDLTNPSQATIRKIHKMIREFFKLSRLPVIDQACRFNSYDPHEIEAARTRISAVCGGNRADFPDSAIAVAAFAGHTELVRQYLASRDFSEQDLEFLKDATEAAFASAAQGHTEIVEMLTHSNFSPAFLLTQLRTNALWGAAIGGQANLVRHLVDSGKVSEQDLKSMTYWSAAEGHSAPVNLLIGSCFRLSDQLRGLAFDRAVFAGQTELVRDLLAGGEISKRSLETAVWDSANRGNTEIVDLLIRSRPALSAQLRGEALEAAAKAGQTELVRFLLDHGPIQHEDRVRALEAAIARGYPTIVEILRARWGGCAGLCNRLWSSGPQIAAVVVGALAATTAIVAAHQN
jgi:hypothetical protein